MSYKVYVVFAFYLFKGVQRNGQVAHGIKFHGLLRPDNDYEQVPLVRYRSIVKIMIVHGVGHLAALRRTSVSGHTKDLSHYPPSRELADRNSTPGRPASQKSR